MLWVSCWLLFSGRCYRFNCSNDLIADDTHCIQGWIACYSVHSFWIFLCNCFFRAGWWNLNTLSVPQQTQSREAFKHGVKVSHVGEKKKSFRMVSVGLVLHKHILGLHLWNIKAAAVHVQTVLSLFWSSIAVVSALWPSEPLRLMQFEFLYGGIFVYMGGGGVNAGANWCGICFYNS